MTPEILLMEGHGENHPAEKSVSLRELKWKELKARMDAYRFYIKLILEINAFFYATTGAVMLVYISNDSVYIGLFLLLPILMGTVVGGFLLYATALERDNENIIEGIRNELKDLRMEMEDIPDRKLLSQLLSVFAYIFFGVGSTLSVVPLMRALFQLGRLYWPGLSDRPGAGITYVKIAIGLVILFLGISIVALGYDWCGQSIDAYWSSKSENKKEPHTKAPPKIKLDWFGKKLNRLGGAVWKKLQSGE